MVTPQHLVKMCCKPGAAECPPERIHIFELKELLEWYEQTLCGNVLIDPRNDRVRFESERLPYLIKLKQLNGADLRKPKKEVEHIRAGRKTRKDYGEPDQHRASTLSWLTATITRPTMIVRNYHPNVPGDEIYVKEFEKSGARFKELVVLRFRTVLVPVTSFNVDVPKIRCEDDILWPPKN